MHINVDHMFSVLLCAKEVKQSFCMSVGTKITNLGNLGI